MPIVMKFGRNDELMGLWKILLHFAIYRQSWKNLVGVFLRQDEGNDLDKKIPSHVAFLLEIPWHHVFAFSESNS